MPGTDIFISYSREDRSAARHFAECFTRAGFNVWWDAALRSGETFDEVIEKELRAANAVVVLWSPRSVASRWVRAEATLADRFNKLVPVIIEACNLPIIFELTHAADLADWTGNEADNRWQTLVDDLRRLVGTDEVQEQAPPVSRAAAVSSPAPAPQPTPAIVQRSANDDESARQPAQPRPDELLAALDRLASSAAASLSRPTPEEVEKTRFFKESDEYRMQEGELVHCLQRLDGEEQVTRFVVTPAGLRMGRTPPADVIVPGAGVSRAHCLVELSGDKLRVTDLNSTNGTYIDNKRVDRSATLAVGSILRIGSMSFEHEVRQRSELDASAMPDLGNLTGPSERRLAGS
ncbi:MAG: TIR domain-containing protein [Sphingomonas sp.]|nr:TIR domain-containing protein [Sphingomonas sp.]